MGSNRRLEGKVAIVVGVSEGGLGKAAALAFAGEGAAVTVAARTQSRIEKVAEEIRAKGGQAIAVSTDATIKDQVDNMVEATVKQYGTVDILFYNAGGSGAKGADELRFEDWQATIDKNLTGAFLCTQAVLRKMMPQKRGRIIITASGAGVRPTSGEPAYWAYSVGNAAEIALARALAAATTYHNITVNVICPGAINSPEYVAPKHGVPSDVHGKPRNPQRYNQPEEIADVVLFLASYESRALTGAVIPLYFRSDMRAYSVWRAAEPQYIERPDTYTW